MQFAHHESAITLTVKSTQALGHVPRDGQLFMIHESWYILGSYWEEATIKIAMRINNIFAIDFRGWFINQLASNYPRKLITTLQNV